MNSQSEILTDILELYSEIKELQNNINMLVVKNRTNLYEQRDTDYDESIESYYLK